MKYKKRGRINRQTETYKTNKKNLQYTQRRIFDRVRLDKTNIKNCTTKIYKKQQHMRSQKKLNIRCK